MNEYTRKDFYQIVLNDITPDCLQILIYLFWETPDWATELRERHRFLLNCLRVARRIGLELAPPMNRVKLAQHEPVVPLQDDYDQELYQKALEDGLKEARQAWRATRPEPVES